MQTVASSALADTCLVQRAVKVKDGFGSQKETWNTVATTTARMGTPSGGYISAMAAKLSEQASWQVSLPYGTDVQVKDRLIIDSQTLVVQAVFDPQSYSTVTRVLASELR